MSEFKVCFTKIKELLPHPNPVVERLEIAIVYGFQVIVQKGKYNVGDFALFIPIDSILNQDLESLILGPNPKIKFDKHRVKQIRIQKFPSQGMLVPVEVVKEYLTFKGVLHPDKFVKRNHLKTHFFINLTDWKMLNGFQIYLKTVN
jgi:RNA ligase (TIGR02306 family)